MTHDVETEARYEDAFQRRLARYREAVAVIEERGERVVPRERFRHADELRAALAGLGAIVVGLAVLVILQWLWIKSGGTGPCGQFGCPEP